VLREEQLVAARFSEYPHPIATIASEHQLIVSTSSGQIPSSASQLLPAAQNQSTPKPQPCPDMEKK